MDEKRKPYVTIFISKSDIPRLTLAVGLALLIVVLAGALGWQAYQQWQAKMLETEAQLQDAKSDLEAYHVFGSQLREPLGFELRHSPDTKVIATTCAQIPQDYRGAASVANAGYTFKYTIVDPDAIQSLVQSDSYRLVGEDKVSADWTLSDAPNSEYYTHSDVFRLFPFLWSSSWEWDDSNYAWNEYLRRFCNNTIYR